MDKIRITKRFSFDMAHALDGYNGLCKHIHGHTYFLRVTILGAVNERSEDGQEGFVLDFKMLKQLVEKHIVDVFDHSLVLKKDSKYQIKGEIEDLNDRIIITPFLPSCENLLLHFVEILKQIIPHNFELVALRLDETPTSYAEWFVEDQLVNQ